MKYPGLSTSLRNELTKSEWELVKDNIQQVDNLAWHQGAAACKLLEEAAKKAVESDYYRCAARVLHYYDLFYAPA